MESEPLVEPLLTEEQQRMVGHLGWAALAGSVLAWDVVAPESLSHAFARGLENRYTRPLVIGAWAVTTAHLFRRLPEKADPFLLTINTCRKLRR
jgi:hypothetical protein